MLTSQTKLGGELLAEHPVRFLGGPIFVYSRR